MNQDCKQEILKMLDWQIKFYERWYLHWTDNTRITTLKNFKNWVESK
jgi:hypothetical protein